MKVEETVRFLAVSLCRRRARQGHGLAIKEAATRLKVPEYRLEAIESGNRQSIQPDVLRAYTGLLELHVWLEQGAAASMQVTA